VRWNVYQYDGETRVLVAPNVTELQARVLTHVLKMADATRWACMLPAEERGAK
jgi:hypothetical protein